MEKKKIYDQFLDFVSLEEDLFSFEMKDSYLKFNDKSTGDKEAEELVEKVASRLFCMIATIRKIPIIRASPDGAASMIANSLDKKIRESLLKPSNPFSDEESTFERPVLILFDRNIDYKMMFFHPWAYQPLVHDLLSIHLNSIQFPRKERKKKEEISLDSSVDIFWKKNRSIEWPNVSPFITEMLKEISVTLKTIESLNIDSSNLSQDNKSLSHSNTLSSSNPLSSSSSSEDILLKAKDLGQLVSSVPQLERTKRQLQTHTDICQFLLDQVEIRDLDKFYQTEKSCIFTEKSKSNEEILQLIKSEKGSKVDKLRLFLIHILSPSFDSKSFPSFKEKFETLFSSNASSSSPNDPPKIEEKSHSLPEKAPSFFPLEEEKIEKEFSKIIDYLWKGKEMLKLSKSSSREKSSIAKLMNSTFNSTMSLLNRGSNEKLCELGIIIQEIVNISDSFSQKSFLYLDPKVSSSSTSLPRKTTPFSQCIAFVVGGASYSEYQNICDSLKEKTTFIYGGTDFPSPTHYLHQLSNLN